MPKNINKVVYKPDSQSTDEYMVIVNPTEFKKWKAGDKTIALAQVVESFKIWYSNQGSQGYLGSPSKQQLENILGTSNEIEAVEALLKRGKEQTGESFTSGGGISNLSRGSDNKGRGVSGV